MFKKIHEFSYYEYKSPLTAKSRSISAANNPFGANDIPIASLAHGGTFEVSITRIGSGNRVEKSKKQSSKIDIPIFVTEKNFFSNQNIFF